MFRACLHAGRGDYHWQHEPCWYAVRSKGHWTGDRKQTTLWTIPSGGQDTETVHGTQKPVECMRRPMLNNASPGQSVYEPFLGSGTTLIAAESTGRICLGIEIDPLYVDVAVRRWQAFTGQQATLQSDGRTFEVVAAERGPKPGRDAANASGSDRQAAGKTTGTKTDARRQRTQAMTQLTAKVVAQPAGATASQRPRPQAGTAKAAR